MRLFREIYRFGLWIYPREFRARYADEILLQIYGAGKPRGYLSNSFQAFAKRLEG